MSAVVVGPQIDVHKAVKTALTFFRASFAEAKPVDVQLEEIELSEDERHWLITVGYDNPSDVFGINAKVVARFRPPARKYKVVRIDAMTGRPVSIKIRPGV